MATTKKTTPRSTKKTSTAAALETASPASNDAGTSSRANVIVDDPQLREWITVAAYFRAERRGFANGSPKNDWFEAEREVREQRAHQA